MAAEPRIVEVWADWHQLTSTIRMGFLHCTPSRGKEIFAFEYDQDWLQSSHGMTLEPGLRFLRGRQYLAEDRNNFGMFLDSSPDRWGRVLLARREALLAREGKRVERRLTELDYLLGVYDGHRMGGLRFRYEGGAFLDDNRQFASPPWTSLREALVQPGKHTKGVSPPPNEAQVDHVHPRSLEGSNSYSNLEVRSRVNNITKSNKVPE